MKVRDFTLKKYIELCESIIKTGYITITLSDYLSQKNLYNKKQFVIIRHDIDNKIDIPIALKMSAEERKLGIRSSYFFRMVPDVFNTNAIKEIAENGHEIGYHYEVLHEAKGDLKLAFRLLEKNLTYFRTIVDVKTICQHGGSLGNHTASTFKGLLKTVFNYAFGKIEIKSYKSNDIWKHKKFSDYKLLGEAYLSIDFNKVLYLSDTGVRWDGFKNRVLDQIETDYYKDEKAFAKSTNQLIKLIEQKKFNQLNILVHPANWIDPLLPWIKWQILQKFRNTGKKFLLQRSH